MYDPKPLDMTDALMQVYEKAGCGKGYSAGGAYSKGGEKKLDAVGKEDKDIDNDGDHDKSDKYLLNRRKVRGQAIATRKEEVEEIIDTLDEEQLEVVLEFLAGKPGDGYIGHPNLDIKNPLAKKQTKKEVLPGSKGGGAVNRVGAALGDRKMRLDKARGLSYGGKVKKEEILHDLSQLSEEQLEEIHESLFDAAKEKLSGTKIGGRIGKAYSSTPKKAQSAMTQVGQSMASGLVGGSSRNQRGGAGGGLGINKIQRDNNISDGELKKAGGPMKAIMTKGVSGGLSKLGFSKGGKVKKEALVFSDAEIEFLVTEAHDIIENLSDEVLINFFEDALIEMAEDQEDLMEMCNELELRGIMLQEASDKYYDDAVKASKDAAKKKKDAEKESMGDRLKRLASKAGENLKKGAKAVVGAGARAAGHAAGEFSAQKERSKKAAEERNAKKDGEKKSEKKGDGDETGGKLDKVLADIRGRKDSDSDSGGGESSSGGGGEGGGKKKPGLLRRIGKALKSGLKKAVGRTARMVSSGSDKLANRLGEDFEQIDSLIESGLFTWTEIEDIVEGVRDEDPEKGTEERKKRLEKKRGMKLDDHPQYKKEAN
tara:strand:+ start:3154 stop:4944 length:1791 start_codon:yes stop_codon:yes gene_type:complete